MDFDSIAENVELLSNRIYTYKHQFNKYFKINATGHNTLSARQFYILFVIGYAKLHTISEIASLAQQSASSMSLITSKLVKSGYLSKNHPQSTEDNRRVYFHLTDKGQVMLGKISALLVCELSDFLTSLTPDLREYANRALACFWKLTPGFEEIQLHLVGDTMKLSEDTEVAINILKAIILSVTWHKTYRNESFYQSSNDMPLTTSQHMILQCMQKLDIHTVGELSQHMLLSESTISISVSKLCSDGFLEKRFPGKDEDGRRVYFYATQKGCEALAEMELITRKIFIDHFRQLPPAHQKNIVLCVEHLNVVFAQLQPEGV